MVLSIALVVTVVVSIHFIAIAQAPQFKPGDTLAFEVVSIKPLTPMRIPLAAANFCGFKAGTLYTCPGITVEQLIRRTHQIGGATPAAWQVTGAPDWIATSQFEIQVVLDKSVAQEHAGGWPNKHRHSCARRSRSGSAADSASAKGRHARALCEFGATVQPPRYRVVMRGGRTFRRRSRHVSEILIQSSEGKVVVVNRHRAPSRKCATTRKVAREPHWRAAIDRFLRFRPHFGQPIGQDVARLTP